MSKEKSEKTKLEKVLILLGLKEETQDAITSEETTLEDGSVISYENTEIGTPVMWIVEGQEPQPAPDGQYAISETSTLVVADGVIIDVIVTESPAEEEFDEAGGKKEDREKPKTEEVFNMARLQKMVNLDKDGFHTLTFSVANGKIEWGNIYSESFQELKANSTNAESKIKKLEKQVKDLKSQHKEQLKMIGETLGTSGLIQAPVETKLEPKTWKERRLESLKEKAHTIEL